MYSIERNVQILVYLLKANNIKDIVLSPGTANMCFALSVQGDDFFRVYSVVDERSAAYMACGIAQQSAMPVVISCTGATASRNYLPALTEAFYRRLPILEVTATLSRSYIGNLKAQQLDRSLMPKDSVCESLYAHWIKDEEDEQSCNLLINRAINTCIRKSQPVHIDLETRVSKALSSSLPKARKIDFYRYYDELPKILSEKIIVFIGAHAVFSKQESEALEAFCQSYSATVIADHSANCKALAGRALSLEAFQKYQHTSLFEADLLIDIGSICGDYYSLAKIRAKRVWRVDPLGNMSDRFSRLEAVFEMREIDFFSYYRKENPNNEAFKQEIKAYELPTLPFSNIYIASQLSPLLPKDSVLHLAILNSLRSWNFVQIDSSITVFSNVGAFGIDGCLSTAIGSAIASRDREHFLVIGDLAFFYDMNALGNRHFPDNLHILLVNNALGVEFTLSTHPASMLYPQNKDFIAADGHFSNKNKELVSSYSQACSLKYFRARTKEDFLKIREEFIKTRASILECFVDPAAEDEALRAMAMLEEADFKDKSKNLIRNTFGDKAVKIISKVMKG